MEMAESLREAFSGNITLVVDDLVAQGLKVVAQISYKAEVGDKKARWTGTAVMEVEDGKIVKSWVKYVLYFLISQIQAHCFTSQLVTVVHTSRYTILTLFV
jgi:hypothetical protein